jgi:hypothetical protein
MKRADLQNSRRILATLTLLAGIFVSIPVPAAQATNDVQASCVIGSSNSCPAQSPQEIFNLYGTSTNGSYWLNVNGTATQTYLVMDTSYPDGGMWFLGMKGSKGSTTFTYSTNYWTLQTTTVGTTSLSNDVSTDAKFDAFNYLPVTKLIAVFKDRNSNAFNASGSGDLGANPFLGHTWMETVTSTTMFSRFTTNSNLVDAGGNTVRYTVHRETNSSSGKLVFPYQTGWTRYGFNNSTGYNYRWGTTSNNESSMGSNDSGSGIGMDSYSAAGIVSYSDNLTVGPDGGSGTTSPGNMSMPSGFQIWGKMAAPSMAAPTSLSRTTIGNGSLRLNIGAASGAVEYAVQYKLSANAWSSATTVRVTNPSASPTATLTGLASGTYDFRVWTRGTNDSSNTSVSLTSQVVDSTAPTLSSIAITSSSGSDNYYGALEYITLTATFSEAVTVSGSPRFPIVGLTSSYLTYDSGSGSTSLLFKFQVSRTSLNRDGISVAANSLALNGGTITDAGLNTAVITHAEIPAALNLRVDGYSPNIQVNAIASDGATLTFTADETLAATSTPTSAFVVTVGSLSDPVTAVTINGTSITLSLTYAIMAGKSVGYSYTDPGNVTSLQDLAGNAVNTVSIAVGNITNNSTVTSNSTIALALNPASTTAVYRAATSVKATVSAAGKVDFYFAGKIITGCRNIATSGSNPIIATCSWKPAAHGYLNLTATLKPTSSAYTNANSTTLILYVTRRAGQR